MNKNVTSSMLLGFFTVLLWASSYTFTRIALVFYTPEALGFLRYLFASLFLLVFALFKRIKLPKLSDVPSFIVSGFTGFAFYVYAFNKGSVSVSASTSSVLVSTAPIITAIIVYLFFKEHIKRVAWLAIFLEFSGIVIITLNDAIFSMNRGIIWIMLAALSIATYNAWQRKLLKKYSPIEATTYSIFFATLILSIFAPSALKQLSQAPFWQGINAVCLGIFPGALAYLFWSMAISRSPKVTTVTNFMFLTPLLSSIIGLIVIREVPSVVTIFGGIIIIGSSILFQKLNAPDLPKQPINVLEGDDIPNKADNAPLNQTMDE